MALAGAPSPDPQRRRVGLFAAAAPVVHTLTEADLSRPDAKAGFQFTQAVVARAVLSLLFASMAFYYLHTGRRNNDPGRLIWAAAFGVLTLLVWCV